MKYCSNCGVELDQTMEDCPLCYNQAAENKSKTELYSEHFSVQTSDKGNLYPKNEMEKKQNRKLFWELTVLVFLSMAIITFLIDLFTSQQLSWSKYTITCSLFLLINSSLISFLRHKSILLTAGSFISIAAMLLALDYFGEPMGWGLKLGIPLLVLLYLFALCIVVLIKYLKEKGVNFIAWLLIISSVVCLGVEVILDIYLHHHITMGWSFYVLLSTLPVAGILLFVHYRMKKGRELKRLFHM